MFKRMCWDFEVLFLSTGETGQMKQDTLQPGIAE